MEGTMEFWPYLKMEWII